MLGVMRPQVWKALLVLEAEQVIHQGGGRIHIVNRDGLEALSRDCYRQTARHRQPKPATPESFLIERVRGRAPLARPFRVSTIRRVVMFRREHEFLPEQRTCVSLTILRSSGIALME